jgi:arginine utilization protein RocB
MPEGWLPGRGLADMKSGVAATISVMRHLAGVPPEERPLSVVLLATPDEEHESAGILAGVDLLARLGANHDLDYVGAINTDYTSARYPGDSHRYIYLGSVGKLLPSFFVVGRPAHAGAPFDGLNADVLAAALLQDLSLDPDLVDTAPGHRTPPPVVLHAADLKTGYNTQIPYEAYFYLNVLTLTTSPGQLLSRMAAKAQAALDRCTLLLAAVLSTSGTSHGSAHRCSQRGCSGTSRASPAV